MRNEYLTSSLRYSLHEKVIMYSIPIYFNINKKALNDIHHVSSCKVVIGDENKFSVVNG